MFLFVYQCSFPSSETSASNDMTRVTVGVNTDISTEDSSLSLKEVNGDQFIEVSIQGALTDELKVQYLHVVYCVYAYVCMSQWRRKRRRFLYPHPNLSLGLVSYKPFTLKCIDICSMLKMMC